MKILFWVEKFNVFKSECAESPLASTRCFCRNQLSALLLISFGPETTWFGPTWGKFPPCLLRLCICILLQLFMFVFVFSSPFLAFFFSYCKFFFLLELCSHAFVFGGANLIQFSYHLFLFFPNWISTMLSQRRKLPFLAFFKLFY